MNTKNLWGDLPHNQKLENLRTPSAILKEQATILSKMTDGLLIGEVNRRVVGEDFRLIFSIQAPALNNYRYSILEVKQPVELYPVFVQNLAKAQQPKKKCQTEEEFEQALSEILSSPEVGNVIGALLSDIRA